MTKAESKPKRRRHDGPSAVSLREIPPSSSGARKVKGRGPEALRNAQQFFAAARGRPAKGRTAVGTMVRSLRLPNTAWDELERVAAARGLALTALVRTIIAEFLYTDPPTVARPTRRATAAKHQPRRAAARRARTTVR